MFKSHKNTRSGTVNYIYEIAERLENTGVLFHSDQVQAGYRRADLGIDVVDFATISAHKFHGPKGVGAIYAKDASLLQPLINGGFSQEFGLRGGTENTPGIVGMGVACELFQKASEESAVYHSLVDLRNSFLGKLNKNLGGLEHYMGLSDNGVHLNCCSSLTEGVSSLRIDGVLGETLVLMMGSKGVCISAGSACTSNSDQPSHVLLAFGLSEDEARSTVRISFSKYTTREEVVGAAEIMAECVKILRSGTVS